jgi:copper homeostasis protein
VVKGFILLKIFLYLTMKFKLEICVDNIVSAIIAQESGADRIELCGSLPEGGTTPGLGTIRSVRENVSIGLHVIIRPRGGDFLYSKAEYEIMKRDIEICGENEVNGVVLGILLPDGNIDVERTARLIEYARPMSATFHRAYDLTDDALKSLEDVISTGAGRLLTSGQHNKAEDGLDLISKLVEISDDRIIIMPGSGINELNIRMIANITRAKEFHLTGRKKIDSGMIFRRDDVYLGGNNDQSEFVRKIADGEVIRSIISTLKMI